MKRTQTQTRSQSGILLIDLLIYMALLMAVLAMLAAVFHKALAQGGQLRRNVDDVERAIKAGERWRGDVRAATGPIRLEALPGGEALVIPQPDGEIVYELLEKNVRRRGPGAQKSELALAGVKSARMFLETREHAAGWRWELELEPRRKNARVKPLFTFTAVPKGS